MITKRIIVIQILLLMFSCQRMEETLNEFSGVYKINHLIDEPILKEILNSSGFDSVKIVWIERDEKDMIVIDLMRIRPRSIIPSLNLNEMPDKQYAKKIADKIYEILSSSSEVDYSITTIHVYFSYQSEELLFSKGKSTCYSFFK